MKRKLLVILWCLTYVFPVKAQLRSPVQWSYSAKKVSSTEAVIYFKATMDDGWHIYSVNQKKGGPEKTSFSFLPSWAYALLGQMKEPVPLRKYERVFEMDVFYFEKSVVFSQHVKLKSNQAILKGKIAFMACTAQECLPSSEVEFSVPIK